MIALVFLGILGGKERESHNTIIQKAEFSLHPFSVLFLSYHTLLSEF